MALIGNRKRLAGVFFLFLWLVLAGGAQPLLVVVPPAGTTVLDDSVEEAVRMLKSARKELDLSAESLPIVRLNLRQEQPARVLQQLGVKAGATVQVLYCRRGPDGWPGQLLKQFSPGENLLLFVREVAQGPEQSGPPPGKPAPREPAGLDSNGRIGLLLAYGSDSQDLIQPFLAELGRYWMERYGRVKPSPYPLASYNLSDPEVAVALQKAFPELVENLESKAAICYFDGGRPVKLLEIESDFSLPATTVRVLSSARGRHLADTLSVTASPKTPLPGEVRLTDEQEKTVLLSRLHELAQRLCIGSAEPEPPNRLAHRTLSKIVEFTRVESGGWSEELAETLADYQAEPLLLPADSPLGSAQQQILELIQVLLER